MRWARRHYPTSADWVEEKPVIWVEPYFENVSATFTAGEHAGKLPASRFGTPQAAASSPAAARTPFYNVSCPLRNACRSPRA